MIPRILLALVCIFACSTIASADSLTAGSVWRNQRGSVLSIKQVNADGSFSGSFVNNAAGYRCKGVPYPATGYNFPFVSIATFTVNFTNCYTITVWRGSVLGAQYNTSWNFVYSPPGQAPQFESGADSFTRIR